MKIILLLLVIIYQVLEKQACVPNPTNEQAADVWDYYVKNHYEGKPRPTRGYYNIPMSKKVEYGKWLIQYVKKQRKAKVQSEDFLSSFDMPPDWSGVGGEEGQLPPPWAYVKGGYSRPDYCYDPFITGTCPPKYLKNLVLIRYGYNSWTEQCERFNYSGCGGNENRFIRKYECEKACRSDRTCCGDQNYKIY
ncbi:unnamed protein product [Arctia plantaginis]|uniref:BPTI/Kunitz inhibitor domain-containing protein n=1 Tax=Arctia plantaginis TaxID=874455 RepID=A0A8S1BDI6_ARCPL|nr:unnamed protein product [Arctia plantaginis]